MDREIRGLDQLHKYMWVLLIARMFEGMACNLIYTTDLRIFISVINGALILHCEDSSMLRLCMATYINAATQFKNLFATNGYMLIMPTILRVYSNYQSNKMVCKIIEMVVKQLYILHRKPFVLQMLGSVAPLLDTDDSAIYGDANKIRGSRLFDLLHSLDRHHEDHIHILDLVTCEKPLKALDFCYHDESDNLSLLEVVDMCVTVVAYAADSRRGHQMLAILEAILAKTLQQFQKSSRRDFRQEKETIHHVAVAIKTLIINSEPLAKNYNGPQLSGMGGGEVRGSNRAQYTKASRSLNTPIEPDDDSHSKYVSDPKRPALVYQSEIEDPELLRQEFRQPRAMFLNIVAEFFNICTPRLTEINRKLGMETKQSDLLDTKCHLRLAEVAHSLLKMAPYDPMTMGCQGLQRYINEILPSPDWSHEDLRPALVNILRRLEKMFNKLAKKSAVRRITDWGAASSLLRGVYTTLNKHPYIAHLPHLKMLVQVCQSLVLGERHFEPDTIPVSVTSWTNAPPQDFCSVVVRIIAMQLLALGVTYSLEQICGGSSLYPNSEKSENLIVHLLLPMCLRIGCAPRDSPRMRQVDISFAVTVVLHSMNPPLAKIAPAHPNPQTKSSQQPKATQPTRSGQGSDPRSQSWSHYHLDAKTIPKVKPAILKIAFLGLKVMVVCFDKQLSKDWLRVVHCLRDMESRGEGGVAMWDFLDFSVSYRSPLSLLIRPFILLKLKQPGGNEAVMQYKAAIKDKLCGASLPPSVCKGALLRTLGQHLKILRDELQSDKAPEESNLRPPSLEIQSEVSTVLRRTKTSTEEKRPHSPTRSGKEGVFPPSANESRLYRKTFLLRKRASSASLRIAKKAEATAETSTPGSPVKATEGGELEGGSVDSEEGAAAAAAAAAAANKHRLQRQMAQSRKTFRFRKSRYGQTEPRGSLTPSDKESQQGISHIDVEPSQVPAVVPPTTTVDDSSMRQLYVPLIPEEEQGTKSPKYSAQSIQSLPHPTSSVESEGISDAGGMETMSGYKESLAAFDASLKDLERLELQVRSNLYQSVSQQYSSRKTSKSDQSTVSEIMSHQSPSTSSQASRQSSISRKRRGYSSHEIASSSKDQLSYESLQSSNSSLHKIQVGSVQSYPLQNDGQYGKDSKDSSKYPHPRLRSGKDIGHPPQSFGRVDSEIQEEQLYPYEKYVKSTSDSKEYVSSQTGGYHAGKSSSSSQSSRDYPQFYEKGSNFRHSWTEGEGTSHIQTYSREKGGTSTKSSKGPSRKTGVAGPKALPSTRLPQTEQHRTRSHYRQEQAQTSFYGASTSTSVTVASAGVCTSKRASYDVESAREITKRKSRGKDDTESLTSEDLPTPIIISGTSLPEGAKRFVVDKFTVTFTEKDGEEDTLI